MTAVTPEGPQPTVSLHGRQRRPQRIAHLSIARTYDLLQAAKPHQSMRSAATIGVCTGQLAEVTDGACPSFCPSAAARTTGSVFDIVLLKCSGAKGTRTPGLLHAMRIQSVDPSPAQSSGEPPTCNKALR